MIAVEDAEKVATGTEKGDGFPRPISLDQRASIVTQSCDVVRFSVMPHGRELHEAK